MKKLLILLILTTINLTSCSDNENDIASTTSLTGKWQLNKIENGELRPCQNMDYLIINSNLNFTGYFHKYENNNCHDDDIATGTLIKKSNTTYIFKNKPTVTLTTIDENTIKIKEDKDEEIEYWVKTE